MKQCVIILLLAFISFSAMAQKDGIHEIRSLAKMADSSSYGLTPARPVKVGKGTNGGPANQRAYLDLLRDEQGNRIEYKRIGSCCPYESENGFGGYAMIDKYEVSYKDKDGKAAKLIIYISFYDYEEPLIPVGFRSSAQN